MSEHIYNNIYPIKDYRKSYYRFLQNQEYIKDINGAMNYNFNSLNDTLKNTNAQSINSIEKGIKSVCGTIENGVEIISNHLEEINYNLGNLTSEISSLSFILDYKLTLLIEQQRITNLLLGNISNLLKIPEFQKEKVYFIEKSLKFISNAISEGYESDFYDKAYDCLNEALKKENDDYIVLNRLGFIHLYSKRFLDFAKAELFFRQSIRYSLAELNVGGTNTSNTLDPFKSDFELNSNNIFLISTAESMYYCSIACALQGKLNDAIKLSKEAFELVPSFLNAGFETAKYLCLNNQPNDSILYLDKIVQKDRYQAKKIACDDVLMFYPEVVNFLEKIRIEAERLYHKKENSIIEKANVFETKSNLNNKSLLRTIVEDANKLKFKNDYLSLLLAIDYIDSGFIWKYEENFIQNSDKYEYEHYDSYYSKNNQLIYLKSIEKRINTTSNIYISNNSLGCYNIFKNRYKKLKKSITLENENNNYLLNSDEFLAFEISNFENLKIVEDNNNVYYKLKRQRINNENISLILNTSLKIFFGAIALGVVLGFCKGCSQYNRKRENYQSTEIFEPFYQIVPTVKEMIYYGIILIVIIAIVLRLNKENSGKN